MTETTFNLRHYVSLALARAMIEHPQEDHDVLADAAIAAYRQHPDGAAADQTEIARLVKSRNKWGRKYNETLEKLRLAVMSDEQYVKAIEDKFAEQLSDYQNAIARAEKSEAERDAALDRIKWLEDYIYMHNIIAAQCNRAAILSWVAERERDVWNAGWIVGKNAAVNAAKNCGDVWSGSGDLEKCLQEAAADSKCAEIVNAIRALTPPESKP